MQNQKNPFFLKSVSCCFFRFMYNFFLNINVLSLLPTHFIIILVTPGYTNAHLANAVFSLSLSNSTTNRYIFFYKALPLHVVKCNNQFCQFLGTRVLLAEPGQSKDDIGFVKTMIAGAVGGLVLWTIIFPSDVIKSRMQISNKSQKFMTVAADIVRKEG